MDLKSALKDILPRLTLKGKHKLGEKWAIERPIEYHECFACSTMVDERIIDICIYTASDEQAIDNQNKYGHWCQLHDAPDIIASSALAKPCVRCYRWTITKTKGSICWSCRHNPWAIMPPPMITKRLWYVKPLELEPELEPEESCDTMTI